MSTLSEEKTTIAIPVANGQLCLHFGHCQQFALFEVDLAKQQIVGAAMRIRPLTNRARCLAGYTARAPTW